METTPNLQWTKEILESCLKNIQPVYQISHLTINYHAKDDKKHQLVSENKETTETKTTETIKENTNICCQHNDKQTPILDIKTSVNSLLEILQQEITTLHHPTSVDSDKNEYKIVISQDEPYHLENNSESRLDVELLREPPTASESSESAEPSHDSGEDHLPILRPITIQERFSQS